MIALQTLPTNPFWNFSIKIYRYPNVKENLIKLQDERGLNINVLLYCCWHSLTDQGRITKSELRQILINIQHWHERIVLPLRRVRQQLKQAPKKSLTNLYQEVLKRELVAEQIEQLIMLENLVFKTRPIRSNFHKIVNICKNIAIYCHLLNIFLDRVDCERLSRIIKVIFSKIDQEEILGYCVKYLIQKDFRSVRLIAQFPLDL